MNITKQIIDMSALPAARWSGGATTQLLIWPQQAVYAERDFVFRLSSAVVEDEQSLFTALPDYSRHILTLSGDLELSHDNGAPLLLRPLEAHSFDGAERTLSRGRVTDLNLMLRKGQAAGGLSPLQLSVGSRVVLPQRSAAAWTQGERLLFCATGRVTVSWQQTEPALELSAGQLLRLRPGRAQPLPRLDVCALSDCECVDIHVFYA